MITSLRSLYLMIRSEYESLFSAQTDSIDKSAYKVTQGAQQALVFNRS